MRHGALVPGKCIRGCLVYASGRALGIDRARLDRLACAVELTHVYSLIHDDLPCMDDDGTRRGRPSCHVIYGEATALLAGNALLVCAIGELAGDEGLPGTQRSAVIARLCRAIGSTGLVGGQQLDIELGHAGECRPGTLDEVYRLKTGCLIHTAVMLPTELVELGEAQRDALDSYGWTIGLAFQVRDDLDDMEQDGSPEGANPRHTYPALLGVGESRRRLAKLGEDALAGLGGFGSRAELLRELGRALTNRSGARHFGTEK